jgi:hypothetical protein
MAKVIAEKSGDAAVKQVEIKHTRVMKNAAGSNVTVVDWTDVKPVAEAITQAEADLVVAEAKVVELKADIAAYIVIRDS